MRIGFFTSIEGWGGSESYLRTLILGARQAGHEPILVGIENTRLWTECDKAGVKTVAWRHAFSESRSCNEAGSGSTTPCALPTRKPPVSPVSCIRWNLAALVPDPLKLWLGNVRDAIRTASIIRRLNLDLLHVNINGYEVAGVAGRLAGIPAVGMFCIMPEAPNGAMRNHLYRAWNAQYAHYLGMSVACMHLWQNYLCLMEARCEAVPNGIRLADWPYHGPRCGNVFYVISVGRLHPMKGFDVLIRAMAHDVMSGARLTIVGEGPARVELQALIDMSGLSQRVNLIGHREDVRALLAEADCFVLASVSHESFGFALVEAMATGLPVVTSDYGPFPEINVNGQTGLVVPQRNSESLATALRIVRTNPDLAVRMGEAGRKRVAERYTEARMIEQTLAVYERVGLKRAAGT